jgi:mannose-1-phosphate guanylyltransferase
MNIVLLSGGSGKRLWPLSNDIRSKQFIKMFKTPSGTYESMLQRIFRQIKQLDPNVNITITTSKSQVSTIRNQLGDNLSICVEPSRKDTFPAIALAASYLYHVKKLPREEVIVICPVDPYVDLDYFEALFMMSKHLSSNNNALSLLGIEPTHPSEKYGYIIPKSNERITQVKYFKEKPSKASAELLIKQGALWNGGVFVFSLGYILDKIHKIINFSDYDDLLSKYESLNKISFDFAVVEKEENIDVFRFSGQWVDLGTWNTISDALKDQSIGRVTFDDHCKDVNVINELDIPILCMGLENIIVGVSPDGILISNKEKSSYIKPYVENINQQVMFAEKSWGSYRVIDIDKNSLTIKVVLNPGEQMSYHSHEQRDEVWVVIFGRGKVTIDGKTNLIMPGDILTIKAGCKHTIIADSELRLIEIQIGENISKEDKMKHMLK